MADSDNEFGDFDLDAMDVACTQAEASIQSQVEIRPAKRRRTGEPNRTLSFASVNPELKGTEDTIPFSESENDASSRPRAQVHPLQRRPANIQQRQQTTKPGQLNSTIEKQLADLPAETFSSSPRVRQDVIEISSQQDYTGQWQSRVSGQPVKVQKNLKQQTLFGTQAGSTSNSQPRSQSTRRYRLAAERKDEPPTHHELDEENMKTWTYPMNLGKERSYQYSIVSKGLFDNLLVALPTGLGKTFIAATIMLNWFRWTKTAQIIFVAPTKPLVAQQVTACFSIAGIPRSETIMLTGECNLALRAVYWKEKRVFFMTPQTVMNDLSHGYADPKRIVLVVVDEAHRATGKHSYVQMVNNIKRFNPSFRVLALTATPGSTVEAVQEVIDGLNIARTEIRTEESLDIRDYVQPREIEPIILENSPEMIEIMELFTPVLRPLINKIRAQSSYMPGDPMSLSPYLCTTQLKRWITSDAGRKASHPVRGMMSGMLSMLAGIGAAIELLKFHSIACFHNKLMDFQLEAQESKSRYKKQIINEAGFKEMMSKMSAWRRQPTFIGHPKLQALKEIVMNHFLDAGEGRDSHPGQPPQRQTSIMVFAQFRDSVEEIVRVLKLEAPIVRAHGFYGQATSSRSEGMKQKEQLGVIDAFKKNTYNTLVATSIGEEGLDIGEVDLIICYDASASPIRMLQRIGRTGRKRAGKIKLFLMSGKEEEKFEKAKDNYEKMQGMIEDGRRFTYHTDLSPRIIPKHIQPEVDKKVIDIPVQNSQAGLPVPEKRRKVPKKPPKKFHMPDNVETGFKKASRLVGSPDSDEESELSQTPPPPSPLAEPAIPIEEVLLSEKEEAQLERDYLSVHGVGAQMIRPPNMSAYFDIQRHSRPTSLVAHGRATKTFVRMMKAMRDMAEDNDVNERFESNLAIEDQEEIERYYTMRRLGLHDDPPASQPERRSKHSMEDRDDEEQLGLSSMSQAADDDNDFDELEDDDSLKGFIDDGDDTLQSISRRPSSTSSPPLVDNNEPIDSSMESDEELPDLDMLIRGSKKPQVQAVKEPMRNERRRRRAVVDSDDESEDM